ncbi:MerR family transcriptional regulator [Microlunatus soli]|uniref:DNA-binding transcriptional regulator, MerR family n=1 Tax=Microlunatus soli TaxID=630515 RepID=A0A1H1ME47_9ACTN|nr:MerR family transcriptional regulator [Microlunatus soli]SDR85114.1 DNA-binding transcriptional regulator, MerR family [Microlunatus soli]
MDGMRISQLAARSGVPVSTLRYYEAEGLLPASRAGNGYRVYDESAVGRLAFITQAKSLSLPLSEIRDLVTARDAEPCRAIRTRYRPLLAQHAEQVQERIDQLRDLQAMITGAQQHLDTIPDRDAPCDADCSFLNDPPTTPTATEPFMITIDPPVDIACTLDGDGYAERAAGWRSLIADAPASTAEDGLRFRLPVSLLPTATELAVAEQQCCPFFGIGFDLHGSQFDLTVSAPPEAAAKLAQVFGGAAS